MTILHLPRPSVWRRLIAWWRSPRPADRRTRMDRLSEVRRAAKESL